MTIYQAMVDLRSCVISTIELKPGKHELSFAGASVPIEVGQEDELSIYLSQAKGDLGAIYMPNLYPDQLWTEEEIANFSEIKLKLKNEKIGISLADIVERTGLVLSVLQSDENPVGRQVER